MTHDFNLNIQDIEDGRATVLVCPYCTHHEIWSHKEYHAHGMCRTYPILDADGTCPACGEEPIAPNEED